MKQNAQTDVATGVDRDAFLGASARFASGVTIVGTVDQDGRPIGGAVATLSSLSLEPPAIVLCLPVGALQRAVSEAGTFATSILREDQALLVEQFPAWGSGARPLDALDVTVGANGSPVLTECLASLECRIAKETAWQDFRIYLAHVGQVASYPGRPLMRHEDRLGHFEALQEAADYERLRDVVLDKAGRTDRHFTVEDVAGSAGVGAEMAGYAASRLRDEGLIRTATGDGASVITPIDARASDAALDAKLLIEMTAAELAMPQMSAEHLDELELRRTEVARVAKDGRTSLPDYRSANSRFHEYVVSLAGNAAVLDAYRRVNVPTYVWETVSDADREAFAAEHEQLVEAYRIRSLTDVHRLLTAHCERAKRANRQGIEERFGRTVH